MKIRELVVSPLIVLWGLLTIAMMFIHPAATAILLKETAEKSGVMDV